jgi:hypothetical protein
MPHDIADRGRAHGTHHGDTERPQRKADEDPLAPLAGGHSRFVQAVEAHRHPWAALVRTVDSVLSARHDIEGTTDVPGRNVRRSVTGANVVRLAYTLPEPSTMTAVSRTVLPPFAAGRRLSLARIALASSLAVVSLTSACAAQRAATPLMMASVGDDVAIASAFRALLDDVIGDSADKICLSIADPHSAEDSDPSPGVLRALRGTTETTVLPRSTCVADERNFGNPRGLLRLRDVSRSDPRTLIAHADAVGDHTAHYECVIPYPAAPNTHSHCRMTSRD